jgi:hypothetical protein
VLPSYTTTMKPGDCSLQRAARQTSSTSWRPSPPPSRQSCAQAEDVWWLTSAMAPGAWRGSASSRPGCAGSAKSPANTICGNEVSAPAALVRRTTDSGRFRCSAERRLPCATLRPEHLQQHTCAEAKTSLDHVVGAGDHINLSGASRLPPRESPSSAQTAGPRAIKLPRRQISLSHRAQPHFRPHRASLAAELSDTARAYHRAGGAPDIMGRLIGHSGCQSDSASLSSRRAAIHHWSSQIFARSWFR